MGEVRFMISEAAKQVKVESHVLRYWEEELNLEIGRTEMGHRYYTKDDIQLFRCIKKLKDEGMLLKGAGQAGSLSGKGIPAAYGSCTRQSVRAKGRKRCPDCSPGRSHSYYAA